MEYQISKAYANITIWALWWEIDETENCRPLYNMSPKPGSRDNNYMQKQYVDVSLARATPYNNLIVPFMIIILALTDSRINIQIQLWLRLNYLITLSLIKDNIEILSDFDFCVSFVSIFLASFETILIDLQCYISSLRIFWIASVFSTLTQGDDFCCYFPILSDLSWLSNQI